jgi:fructose-1,6-bisphosphatase/inositol monophosphatase family enzyme
MFEKNTLRSQTENQERFDVSTLDVEVERIIFVGVKTAVKYVRILEEDSGTVVDYSNERTDDGVLKISVELKGVFLGKEWVMELV